MVSVLWELCRVASMRRAGDDLLVNMTILGTQDLAVGRVGGLRRWRVVLRQAQGSGAKTSQRHVLRLTAGKKPF